MLVHSCANSEPARADIPVATIKAYRRTGGAVVTIQRDGRSTHRYKISLHRYHALREWTAFGSHPWKSSGAWLNSSLTAYLWTGKEVRRQP